MYYRFIFSMLVFLACQSLYAAGPVCFNYEVYEHPTGRGSGVPPLLNVALQNYDHQTIRQAGIPALGNQLGISLSNGGVHPFPVPLYNLGAPLTFPESCIMAMSRQNLGIKRPSETKGY